MVKLATYQSQKHRSATAERVNGFPGENELKDLRFKLAHNLQSTLNLHNTIELFFSNIQDLVTVHGIQYDNPDMKTHYSFGKAEKHSAKYKVASSSTHLGNIQFFRKIRFSEPELATLEMLIGILFYPLRNALLYKEALESSLRDTLTGIGNRAALEMSFEREIKLAKRHKHPFSLMIIDIDHFKEVNDNLGHRNGDKVLQHIVKTVQSTLRETDQIFRFGGEEFVALLHNTDIENARLIAERVRINVAITPMPLNNEDVLNTISIGISHLEEDDSTETLFEKADAALYQAKNTGRNKVYCQISEEEKV